MFKSLFRIVLIILIVKGAVTKEKAFSGHCDILRSPVDTSRDHGIAVAKPCGTKHDVKTFMKRLFTFIPGQKIIKVGVSGNNVL